MAANAPGLLATPAASHWYRTIISPFTIDAPTKIAFASPLQSTPTTVHCTQPAGHGISISLHLPDLSYGPDSLTFQFLQLWRNLLSAIDHHNPPLPNFIIDNLWMQLINPFLDQWFTILQVDGNQSKPHNELVQQFLSIIHIAGPDDNTSH